MWKSPTEWSPGETWVVLDGALFNAPKLVYEHDDSPELDFLYRGTAHESALEVSKKPQGKRWILPSCQIFQQPRLRVNRGCWKMVMCKTSSSPIVQNMASSVKMASERGHHAARHV